jgi:predicted ATPase/DNA-binding CsgD family transcriptional regulator
MTPSQSLTRLNVFVGRKSEMADVQDRLLSPECHLLTITGLGGSGKTRLAIEAAHAIAPHFQDGVVFVALQQIPRSDLLVQTIAQALNLTLYGEDDTETQVFNYLSDKSMLLFLDNFEHLLIGAPILSTILSYAPNVKILVSSREALNLQEEWLYPLKGMSIPLSTYTTSLEDYEAVQLFLYHARRVQPSFDLAHEHESIIRICTMTAGLPLAIELAASWLKGLTASQIAAAMRHNLDFLSTTARNIEERHRSMRAVFEQSWKLLPENEQRIFARLSIFLGGFDADAADQVAGASFSVLAGLVEKSLVQMASSDRFTIHEILRQYGLEKLEAFGETGTTYTQHSAYFAQRMLHQEAALKQLDQMETMRSIERDFENVRLAWEWAISKQQGAHVHAMLNSLYLFGFLGSRNVEVMGMFQQSLEQTVFDSILHSRMLVRRWGFLHWWCRPDYEDALAGVEQALTIALAENNQFEVAFCHLIAAYALKGMARLTDAVSHLETSKALFETIDEPYYVCWVLHRLGAIYSFLDEPEKEVAYMEQSLTLARHTENRFALFSCLFYLGSDHFLRRNYIKGKHYGAEALQFANGTGQQCQIAHAAGLVALCAFYEGDYNTCWEYAEHSRTIIKDIISLLVQPYSLSLLVLLACLREDYSEGVRLIEMGNQYRPNLLGFQLNYWALAALACGLGNPKEARTHLQKLLQLADSEEYSALVFGVVPCAAYVLAYTDRERAVELLSWVNSYPDKSLNWARQWPLFNRLQSQLQAGMDRITYQIHWEKGKAASFETIELYIQNEFCVSSDAVFEALNHQLLTARESEILRLMAEGMTNPEIASQLVIGTGTVKTHTLNIYRKLEVSNRTQAIIRAQELGMLHLSHSNISH